MISELQLFFRCISSLITELRTDLGFVHFMITWEKVNLETIQPKHNTNRQSLIYKYPIATYIWWLDRTSFRKHEELATTNKICTINYTLIYKLKRSEEIKSITISTLTFCVTSIIVRLQMYIEIEPNFMYLCTSLYICICINPVDDVNATKQNSKVIQEWTSMESSPHVFKI